ncbi:DedA family protein [Paludibacterium purpuratum]|uniref:Membrane protein DedA with SNARE-associated domain n=1 Tax=Paludibacterium purpuratum TaxID=1144873 RepID=A0A4R7B873_9NEIS|nr:VTT domain-containing protein [Paludibacterium purpuratum]TDR79926.1 membrane protein DedA with SNARE-associated domain [Paludibacterium purpuratum]
MTLTAWLPAALPVYGQPALFAAMVLEGPLATVLGAFLASRGLISLPQVYLLAIAADLAGDTLLYVLGRLGRVPTRLWRGARGLRRRRRALWLQAHLRQHAGRLLIAGKWTHALGFLVLIAAGAARLPFLPFLGWNLMATLPKAALFALLGFFGGAAYQRIDVYLWLFGCTAFAALLVVAGAWLRYRILPYLPED